MRRIIKVGGSLLLRDDLPVSLPRWIAGQTQAETLVIVGGGKLIGAVRQLDRIRAGDPAETHWLCVDLLDATYRIFSQWFDWPCISTPEGFAAANANGFSLRSPTMVAVRAFYDRYEGNLAAEAALPLDWRTTTDTIAALLAHRTAADELVLLKSCDVEPTASIEQLAEQRVVDQALPMIQSRMKSIRVEKLV
jgi:aspartokinase-like uncharacterized kinase